MAKTKKKLPALQNINQVSRLSKILNHPMSSAYFRTKIAFLSEPKSATFLPFYHCNEKWTCLQLLDFFVVTPTCMLGGNSMPAVYFVS